MHAVGRVSRRRARRDGQQSIYLRHEGGICCAGSMCSEPRTAYRVRRGRVFRSARRPRSCRGSGSLCATKTRIRSTEENVIVLSCLSRGSAACAESRAAASPTSERKREGQVKRGSGRTARALAWGSSEPQQHPSALKYQRMRMWSVRPRADRNCPAPRNSYSLICPSGVAWRRGGD